MCICTRFICALELAALPNNIVNVRSPTVREGLITEPTIELKPFLLIFIAPDLSAAMKPHGCGFWNDARAHE
jgi:hypothetical protein